MFVLVLGCVLDSFGFGEFGSLLALVFISVGWLHRLFWAVCCWFGWLLVWIWCVGFIVVDLDC